LESELNPEDFSREEKTSLNQTLQKIVKDLNTIKLGQQITYDDVKDEFEELKDLYYLNKKNWVQLFTGKLSEMVAGGVIIETISKDLAEIIKTSYKDLISSSI
jgi:predicted DNA-binding protein (MmcQ/YjbR family)